MQGGNHASKVVCKTNGTAKCCVTMSCICLHFCRIENRWDRPKSYRSLIIKQASLDLADDRLLFVMLLVWSQVPSHFVLKINAIIICLRSILERKISASKCYQRWANLCVSLHGHNSLYDLWMIAVLMDSWKEHAVVLKKLDTEATLINV